MENRKTINVTDQTQEQANQQRALEDARILKAFYSTLVKGSDTTIAQVLGYVKVDIGAVQMLRELLEPAEGNTNE